MTDKNPSLFMSQRGVGITIFSMQSYWGDRLEMHNLYDENKHENDGSDTIAIESTSSVIHKA